MRKQQRIKSSGDDFDNDTSPMSDDHYSRFWFRYPNRGSLVFKLLGKKDCNFGDYMANLVTIIANELSLILGGSYILALITFVAAWGLVAPVYMLCRCIKKYQVQSNAMDCAKAYRSLP